MAPSESRFKSQRPDSRCIAVIPCRLVQIERRELGMDKNGRLLARIIGGVSLAFGIASAVLAVWAIDRQFAIGGIVQISAAAAVVVFLSISAFCCLVGYRLVFNRPNRNGSVLSLSGWKWLALCYWIVGLTMAAIGLGRGRCQLLGAAIGLGVLGFGSVLAGRAAASKLFWSPVFPPDTSLLRMKWFVPAGFLSGIEIMNDNLTPMAFVVSVMQKCVGLSESDAIRTMLDIHRNGGVLYPLPSFDEAKRVAELVTAEAHSKNHPLICRAVRVE
jgi:ATP-dependent Clp protease adapter protein ClpS